MNIKRPWENMSDEQKRKCLDEIVGRVNETNDNEIGLITAEDILDIITHAVGPDIYNQGIEDAKQAVQSKLADLNIDLDIQKATT